MLDSTITRSTNENMDEAIETTKFADPISVIKDLRPINHLPEGAVKPLADITENLKIEAGTSISSIVRDSEYLHYLVEGTLAFLNSGNSKTSLSASDAACLNAVDRRINGSVDLITETNCLLARLPWSELENQLLQHTPSELSSSTLEVKDLLSSTCSDWMVRLLQSDLISMLPAANIQEVLAGVEVVEIAGDEIVINQGDDPDHFYIIEGGSFSVYRDIESTGRQVELATLSVGDFFGEEALITGNQRGTSVKATTASKLLKIRGEQFKKSIVEATILRESAVDARKLLSQGAQLIDVRGNSQYLAGHLPQSINLVLQLLRINSNQLDKTAKYVVAADIPNAAAVATFLLRVRGFDASCLDEPLYSYAEKFEIELFSESSKNKHAEVDRTTAVVPEVQTAAPTSDIPKPTLAQISKLAAEHAERADPPAPVEDYANTVTGIGLADLIEELNDSYETESESLPADSSQQGAPASQSEIQAEIAHELDFDMSENNDLETIDTVSVDLHETDNQEIQRKETIDLEVARLLTQETERLRQEFKDKLEKHKRAALKSIREHKEILDLQFRAKQKSLLANSQKLIALANKVSQQKAEVEKARKSLAEAKS